MRYRPLGGDGTRVSEIGLGCAHLASVLGRPGQRRANRLIEVALDAGITFFDTADTYGAGWSERRLGRALGAKRNSVLIATKCGRPVSVKAKVSARLAEPSKLTLSNAQDARLVFRPSEIVSAAERSLARLGTDYVDVFLLHAPPSDVIREGDWIQGLSNLRARGLIRLAGVSARSPEDAAEIISGYDVDCVEIELNPCTARRAEHALALARERGVGIIARQVFGSGYLLDRAVIEAEGKLSREDAAAVLLHFAQTHSGVSVALVGARSPAHIEANAFIEEPSEPALDVLRIVQKACHGTSNKGLRQTTAKRRKRGA